MLRNVQSGIVNPIAFLLAQRVAPAVCREIDYGGPSRAPFDALHIPIERRVGRK